MASNTFRSQAIAAVVVSVTAVIKAIPETLGITKYKEFFQFYDATKPKPIDDDTNELIEETLFKINLDPHLESRLEMFVNYGQDVIHKGSLNMKSGAIVGLPIFFSYKQLSDIHTTHLKLKNKSIDWNTENGQKFSNSIIMSDKAKKFAIAREIYYAADHSISIDCSLLVFNMSAFYCAYFAMDGLYRLNHRMKWFGKIFLASSFYFMALGSYLFMHDIYQRRRDQHADSKAAKLGKDYIEGGIEFYNLLLQRNAALYALLGEDGKKIYTPFGNTKISVRMKSLPMTARRDFMKETLAKESEEKLKS
ncbi:Hypothetical predicted protein [Octopus vulgaris]|uniref:Uncharacterized protein n=2 Tax=Octopus TaxID=6643 RepID=A0AA36BLE4_OCTVU|nr:transmembrane protein 177 [Octopus sinensis]XP_036365609.1 transmembrane protein 177 [Octopus sinensis]XP_036365610.1 transmembrane protein 177 [Octopus sinensis]XP_036365611.1 transmembrane protein 177 [Octopus sinensis]CAI9735692.1 Hypothetical predicted protein [Octopus vulgaris]